MKRLSLVFFLFLAIAPAYPQTALPAGQGDDFLSTSFLQLMPDEKAAVYVFEDLECPTCARAAPYVREAVSTFKVRLVRYDFPLRQHPWALQAAVIARSLQANKGAAQAEEFRRAVFSSQRQISGPDDLYVFARHWFEENKLTYPEPIDPSGKFTAEVKADIALGQHAGLVHTPTVFVISRSGWIQVVDVSQLGSLLSRLTRGE